MLERLQYEGVVDVFQTVRTLRAQRPAMVQTEDQYQVGYDFFVISHCTIILIINFLQFCYRAALEYLSAFDQVGYDGADDGTGGMNGGIPGLE